MKIHGWEFTVWFDGEEWKAKGKSAGRSITARGETPVTAMINAEQAAYRVEQRNPNAELES